MNTYRMSQEEKDFLASYDLTKYDRPSVAADIAVFAVMDEGEREDIRKYQEKTLKLLLIKRGGFPYKGCWALPGGFCMKGEDVIQSARRELCEETGISDAYVQLVGVYGEPGRDPRGWVISATHMALMNGEEVSYRAGSDAQEAGWFTVKLEGGHECRLTLTDEKSGTVLTAILSKKDTASCGKSADSYEIEACDGLAFDHARIITEAVLGLREDLERKPELAFDLLSDTFTLTELQNVYEQVWDKELITPNFRRKIAEYVEETDAVQEGEGFRPARLYRRK